MGLGTWLAEEMDLRLPTHNVYLRAIILWASLAVPLFVFAYVVVFLGIDAAMEAALGGGDLVNVILLFVVAFQIGVAVLIVLWTWWAPRVAIRPKAWNRWQRTLGCVLVNLVGAVFFGTALAIVAEGFGQGFAAFLQDLKLYLLAFGAPAGIVGAISGLKTKDRPRYYAEPPESAATEPSSTKPHKAKPSARPRRTRESAPPQAPTRGQPKRRHNK